MTTKAKTADGCVTTNFSGGLRWKCSARYAEGTNVIVVAPDVARFFRTPLR